MVLFMRTFDPTLKPCYTMSYKVTKIPKQKEMVRQVSQQNSWLLKHVETFTEKDITVMNSCKFSKQLFQIFTKGVVDDLIIYVDKVAALVLHD